MYVSVSSGEVSLDDPEDTNSFKVVADTDELDRVLRAAGWGRVDGDEALISIDAVRRAAAGRVRQDWSDSFQKMLDYARSKGWMGSDGTEIRAHVERPSRHSG